MAQVKIGTCSVTNGSASVTGVGTNWLTTVLTDQPNRPNPSFAIAGGSAVYTVASVESDTELTLTAPYGGDSVTGANYSITVDFTPNLGLSEINKGDQDWALHLTEGVIRKLDEVIPSISSGGSVDLDTDVMLSSNSDAKAPSQKAVKSYVNTKTYVNILDYIPSSLHAAIKNYTSTTAVDSYIASALASGKPVWFPAGKYIHASQIVNNLTGGSIFGDGPGRTILSTSYQGVAIKNGIFVWDGSTDNFSIDPRTGSAFSGGRTGAGDQTAYGYWARYKQCIKDITLENTASNRTGTVGIGLYGSLQGRYENISFWGYKVGIQVNPYSGYNFITNIYGGPADPAVVNFSFDSSTYPDAVIKVQGDVYGTDNRYNSTTNMYSNINGHLTNVAAVWLTGNCYGDIIISNVYNQGMQTTSTGVLLENGPDQQYANKIIVSNVDMDAIGDSVVKFIGRKFSNVTLMGLSTKVGSQVTSYVKDMPLVGDTYHNISGQSNQWIDSRPFVHDYVNNRIGKGTAAPTTAIDVYDDSDTTDAFTYTLLVRDNKTRANGGGVFALYHNNDNYGLPASGDRLGINLFGSYYLNPSSILVAKNGAAITGHAEADWSTSSLPSYISLETAPTGSNTRVERLRITSDGEVQLKTSGKGIKFADGTIQTSAPVNTPPASSATHIQINGDGSSFYGDSDFKYNAGPSASGTKGVYLGITNNTVLGVYGPATYGGRTIVFGVDTNAGYSYFGDTSAAVLPSSGSLRVIGDINITGDFKKNGVVIGGGGSGTVTSITPGAGFTSSTPITTTGTLDIDVGATANKILKLDSNGRLAVGSPATVSDVITIEAAGTALFTAYNSGAYGSSGGAFIALVAGNNTAISGADTRLGGITFKGGFNTSNGLTTGASIEAFSAGAFSSTTAMPTYLAFKTAGASGARAERFRITESGSVICGTQGAYATTVTDGFLYIPTCAGTPSGVPTDYTGKSAMVHDTTGNKLWIYNHVTDTWKSTTLA